MVINGFSNKGISIGANDVKVQGNFIGTNSAGTTALGNFIGITISGGFGGGVGGGNQIGTPAPADRNLISGNGNGISMLNDTNATNTVQNNYIGVDASGNVELGNIGGIVITGVFRGTTQGATLIGGATPTPGTAAGNVISGNNQQGIRFANSEDSVLGPVTIQGNIIGLGVDGTTVVANGDSGIDEQTANGSTNGAVLIGGTSTTLRNIISGNAGDGIFYAGANTIVQGNYIGSDITGTLDRGNTSLGIELVGDLRDPSNPANTTITIGGTAANAGNLISGNNAGGISFRNANGIVQGNRIGTQTDGTSALGNGSEGIRVFSFVLPPLQVTVGGAVNGAGNIIAHNSGPGVSVQSSMVTILRNSIFNNGPIFPSLGIDLAGGGQNNDTNDPDTGPNNLQNFPVITSATTMGSATTIMGTLNSNPSGTFRIEFFSNVAADSSGFGEGQTFFGSTTVTDTNGDGNESFSFSSLSPVAAGQFISATATDAAGNTSEFSGIRLVVQENQPPVITSNGGGASASISVAENTTAVTTVTATDADLPAQTLSFSISGGADATSFTINGSTGVLSFVAAPDFGNPTDAGADNVYDVIVQVSDGGLTDTQAIAVTVTATNDNNPVITSNGGGLRPASTSPRTRRP